MSRNAMPDFSDPRCSLVLVQRMDARARRKWRMLCRSCCMDVYNSTRKLASSRHTDEVGRDQQWQDARDEVKQDVERAAVAVAAAAATTAASTIAGSISIHDGTFSSASVASVVTQLVVRLVVDDAYMARVALEHASRVEAAAAATANDAGYLIKFEVSARQPPTLSPHLLAKLPHLRAVSLGYLDDLESLAGLPHALQLEELDVLGSSISLPQAKEQLRPLQGLTSLLAHGLRLGTAEAEALSVLAPSLQLLDLGQVPEVITQPIPAFAALTRLRWLKITRHHDQMPLGASFVALAPALAALTGLTGLNLRGMLEIGEDGEDQQPAHHALGQALRCLRNLQELDLHTYRYEYIRSGIEPEGTAAYRIISPALAEAAAPLQHLDLSCSMMGPSGMSAFALALPAFEGTLEVLKLPRALMGVAGALALAPALQRLAALQQLDVSHNRLGAGGAAALAPALPRLQRLQVLGLASNRLGAGGLAALAPSVAAMAALQRLLLGNNFLVDDDVAVLRPLLPALPALRVLDLGANLLGPAAADEAGWTLLAPGLEEVYTRDAWVHEIGLFAFGDSDYEGDSDDGGDEDWEE